MQAAASEWALLPQTLCMDTKAPPKVRTWDTDAPLQCTTPGVSIYCPPGYRGPRGLAKIFGSAVRCSKSLQTLFKPTCVGAQAFSRPCRSAGWCSGAAARLCAERPLAEFVKAKA